MFNFPVLFSHKYFCYIYHGLFRATNALARSWYGTSNLIYSSCNVNCQCLKNLLKKIYITNSSNLDSHWIREMLWVSNAVINNITLPTFNVLFFLLTNVFFIILDFFKHAIFLTSFNVNFVIIFGIQSHFSFYLKIWFKTIIWKSFS